VSNPEQLGHTKTILLTTYKRDGAPVSSPVSIAFAGDRAFFRSYDGAWKTKRLRNNPRVEAAPATLRGMLVPVTPKLRRYRTMHYELRSDADRDRTGPETRRPS
jgi:hypothetical protein